MGEASDYEQMMADLQSEERCKKAQAAEAMQARTREVEQAFAEGPQNEWEAGCEFALKDIVHVKYKGDGK
eukprot:6136821-Prymnesium_polylepis.1